MKLVTITPPYPTVLLMGATATGKTELAFRLGEHIPVRIINVDSVQFYRYLNIGSAKPTLSEQAKHNLHMINICDPSETYTVNRFCIEVQKEIHKANTNKELPLLTGGTMMYLRALTQGLSSIPSAHTEIREQLTNEWKNKGLEHLYNQLQSIDPATAQRLSNNDSQRIVRALEVFLSSGKTLSAWHTENKKGIDNYISFALSGHKRSVLHHRIHTRLHAMLQTGFIEEVERLKKDWYKDLHKPAFRAVGYRQILQYLDNQYDYNTMVDKALAATRQLAKRQITWLRSWPEVHHLNSTDICSLIQQVVATINTAQKKLEKSKA